MNIITQHLVLGNQPADSTHSTCSPLPKDLIDKAVCAAGAEPSNCATTITTKYDVQGEVICRRRTCLKCQLCIPLSRRNAASMSSTPLPTAIQPVESFSGERAVTGSTARALATRIGLFKKDLLPGFGFGGITKSIGCGSFGVVQWFRLGRSSLDPQEELRAFASPRKITRRPLCECGRLRGRMKLQKRPISFWHSKLTNWEKIEDTRWEN